MTHIDSSVLAEINKHTSVVLTREDAEAAVTEALRYNGWSNRETWAAGLHLSNDQELYNHARNLALEDESGDSLEEWIEEAHTDLINEMQPRLNGMVSRELVALIGDVGSLWRVDWREVAESLVEDAASDVQAEEDMAEGDEKCEDCGATGDPQSMREHRQNIHNEEVL